jgi:hypothetical protein
VAANQQDLRNRYGDPEVERFTVRPGIGLTVEYGSDRLARQILIQPPEHILISQEQEARFMPPETVTNVLDEVVPLAMRGKKTAEFHMVSGCNAVDGTEYENARITRSTHNCLPLKPEHETQLREHPKIPRSGISLRRGDCYAKTHIK